MSDEPENPDRVVRETIKLRIPCGCGEVAVAEMTPAQARRTATGLLSAADGLERVEVVVCGEC